MNLVAKHPAYSEIKDGHIIEIIVDYVMSQPNYSFENFSNIIPEVAEDYYNEWKKLSRNSNITDEELKDKIQKLKGNIFEIFIMFTLQYFESDSKIGIEKEQYEQIPDEDDCGVDFIARLYSNEKRVFGQIKFRQDHPHNESFGRIEYDKLIGEAYDEYDFDKNKEYLMLVTNQHVDNALKHKLRDKLGGYINGGFDFKHRYVKFVSGETLQTLIDYNNKRFWIEFKKCFE